MVNDNCHKWGVINCQIPSICYQDIERKQSSYINQELSVTKLPKMIVNNTELDLVNINA